MSEKIKNYGIINIDVFFRDLLVCFGDAETLREALSHCHSEEEVNGIMGEMDTSVAGRTFYDVYFKAFVLWMPQKPKTAQEIGFLSHEIFHASCAIMEKIGVRPSIDSEEAYAYLISFLTKRVWEEFSISLPYPSQ